MSEWLYSEVQRVPEITHAEVEEMRKVIRPVIKVDGMYQEIEGIDDIDAHEVSFIWDAKPTGKEFTFHNLNQTTIITQHHSSVFFKPSLAEVYAWIKVYCPQNWKSFSYFYMGEFNRIGSTSDFMCFCTIMGGEKLVKGRKMITANNSIIHELIPER